ncbi:Acg family FMN-binding oxidoreductase [Actinokineospora xionganensis]|uniref:NAD(P)H nitroreductase n=1 Tax=Actinokineospora xionganensis TaxID=2684470 RepID=A0ABR7L0M9_9PSEU|nr:NAD(P)H nitroreductase [Actinokineospora xionganensis]MBC6445912.1 NAD(P)H nitroreductase [Actinokineospora xionganensis]
MLNNETLVVPDTDTVRAALDLACRAPSVHNSQPWRWRVGGSTVDLFADWSRHLPGTDPDGRDLLVSCGALLHHTKVAFAAFGWQTQVHRMPDPGDPHHLATIGFAPGEADRSDLALAAAILRRRSDRRAYSATALSANVLATLAAAADANGAVLAPITSPAARAPLVAAIARATAKQNRDPRYREEIARWSGRQATSPDGVASSNTVTAASYGAIALRDFAAPAIEVLSQVSGAGQLLVLATTSDDTLSRLRAGEASSAVLLAATVARLAVCPLTQPLEVESTRALVRDTVLGGALFPQMVLRVGLSRRGDLALPTTARRRLDDMLTA